MSTRAYILIETVVGRTSDVVQALSAMSEMKRVDPVTGPYDIVAIVEAKDLPALGDLISEKLHQIPGIAKTVSCLSVSA
ncbi:MAG: Lrp/AsnC ligand binding domain-containing protein [Chloroflexi bacterium]|nr:Lrp/AsnC ligand binding domain-containing protein [Chloroflexota bacterium]